MDTTQLLGYIGALLVGLTLGLLGGGGSILTVPILVYLVGLNPVISTAYSLFVVGTTSLIGAYKNFTKGLVDIKTAIIFAIPAFIAVFITRRFLIPLIPNQLFSIKGFILTKDIFIMVFFAIVMLLAAISMISSKKKNISEEIEVSYNFPIIAIEGFAVGILTGLVGAGGGFLIIPALVLLAKLPMKKAIGTSLFIIAIKSLIGFLGDVHNLNIDWAFLLSFTIVSIIGILIGTHLTKFISDKGLKKGFGWFVLLMAIYIMYMELS